MWLARGGKHCARGLFKSCAVAPDQVRHTMSEKVELPGKDPAQQG